MQTRNVKLSSQRLLVVGPIRKQIDKLIAVEKIYQPKDIVVFIGDISDPSSPALMAQVTNRLHQLQIFMEGKQSYYILGDKDLLLMKSIYTSHADTYDWFNQQSIAIRFNYANNSNIMVLHGGITSKHKTLEDLNNDLELSFVNNILPESKGTWHKNYDGRFGYIISSHPVNKKNKPELYNFSMSLETATDTLIIQEFNDKGLGETFQI